MGVLNEKRCNNPELVTPFQDYIFGADTYKNLWLELLQACKTKQIPVYVITSGNLIGVIRTIQLLGLSDLFEEVISIRANSDTNPNPIINPARYFGGATKPDVIRSIMKEKGIPYNEKDKTKLPLAAFFDDDPGHFEGLNTELVKTSDSEDKTDGLSKELKVCLLKNIFFTTYFKGGHLSRYDTSKNIEYNFTSIQQLKRAISGISGITKDGAVPLDSGSDVYIIMVSQEIEAYKKIKILFLDWDKTVSIWKGPPDFKGVDYSRIEQHLLPPPPPP